MADINKKAVDLQDISVVVQGAIAGSPDNQPEKQHTRRCLESIREILPGAKIILSTWEGANVKGLDYDLLVQSKDPGTVNFEGLTSNCFRQIVSSINGLKKCQTKYAIKARTDFIFKSDKFIKYFIKFNELPYDENYRILKQRVVMLPATDPKRRFKMPFSASDWFFFGLTEDVQNIFDIPLLRKDLSMKGPDGVTHNVEGLLSAEQYIWFSFLSKYKAIPFEYGYDISHDNIATSEKYFANNCILLTARRAGIQSLKYPGTSYARTPALSHTGLYTFTEYKKILNRYAGTDLIIIPNPFEEVAYFTVYNGRFLLKKWPKLHHFVRHVLDREYR